MIVGVIVMIAVVIIIIPLENKYAIVGVIVGTIVILIFTLICWLLSSNANNNPITEITITLAVQPGRPRRAPSPAEPGALKIKIISLRC